MAYLDVNCLDVDGALFDAALLLAVAALSHCEGKIDKDLVNKEKRELNLTNIPFSLTCILHKGYILADPTAEEESITGNAYHCCSRFIGSACLSLQARWSCVGIHQFSRIVWS